MSQRFLFSLLVFLLAAWLLSPALTAVHVEGLSAQLQSQAVAFAGGGIAIHDPYLPLVTEYIFLVHPGVIDLLSWLRSALANNGDLAFHLLTLASLAVLLIASVSFARSRGSVAMTAALAALILTPGVAESGFFFNDNVVSAAFAALALAVLRPGAGKGRCLVSGLCIGMATLCRLDGILALPLVLGAIFVDRAIARITVQRLIALAAGFAIVMAISSALNGVTLLDSLLIGRNFSYARQIGLDLKWNLFALAYFFGPISPLLLLIGVLSDGQVGFNTRRRLDAGFFVIYPLLLCVFAVMTGREVRYLYPLLAPVIALHGGRGIEWLLGHARRQTLLVALLSLFFAVVLLAPPSVVSMSDGPRMLFGRVWSPVVWRQWQQAVNESLSRVDVLAADLDREPAPLVITTSWNGEFFVHLRLAERGYVSSTAAEAFPGCDGFSVYTRGDRRILHLRLHNEFYLVPYAHTVYGALAAARAAECPAIGSVSNTWITTFGSQGDKWVDPELVGFGYERFPHVLELTFTRDRLRELLVHKVQVGPPWCCSDSLFDYAPVTDAERVTILTNAKAIAVASATEAHTTPEEMFTAARQANRGRTKLTRDRWP